jgi:hypothetical protein
MNMKRLLAGAIAAALLSASPTHAGPIVESLSIFNPDGSLFAFSGLDAEENVINHSGDSFPLFGSLSTLELEAFVEPGGTGVGPTIGQLNAGYTIIRDAQGNAVNAFGTESFDILISGRIVLFLGFWGQGDPVPIESCFNLNLGGPINFVEQNSTGVYSANQFLNQDALNAGYHAEFFAAVPEPSTLLRLSVGTLLLILRKGSRV